MIAVNFLTETHQLSIPESLVDLEAFRRWVDTEYVPEKARISYLEGDVWVDLSREQVFSHVYTATRKQQGWLRSAVFGKSFRLTQRSDSLGQPDYLLEMR